MIRILAVLIWCVLAGAAVAQAQLPPERTYPAQFSVRAVAENDVLNIRAEPRADAPIIGSFGPYTQNIEVLRTTPNGAWGFVGMGERNGWVSMQFLRRQDIVDPAALPRPLLCFGNEPFWTLGFWPRGAEFVTPDGRVDVAVRSESVAPEGFRATVREGAATEREIIVARSGCTDGMTDRRYGWRALMFSSGPDGASVLSGCCTLDGN